MKEKVCGIYKITNNLNGMSYIGQSKDCYRRWYEHRRPTSNVAPIDQAINEFGVEKFSFKVLLECPPDMLDVWERDMINLHYSLYPNGYNYRGGGKYEYNDMCEDTRKKMSERQKGDKNSSKRPEVRKKLSESAKNRPPISEDTRKKMSESAKNRPPMSNETKGKISEFRKNMIKPKWLTPQGEIREMSVNCVSHWHKDWKKIEE